MKPERSDVKHPLWRKKVDSSLFRHSGSVIPHWVREIWGVDADFSHSVSTKDPSSCVKIRFNKVEYEGWVTVAKEGRESSPAYRLWFSEELTHELKNTYIMSFVRDIENRLRISNGTAESEIEDEIPFWEFLDIEYDRSQRTFHFRAYYTQKPEFSELFKRFIDSSPILHKIDDELNKKPPFRIYKTDWKKREEVELELGARNVLYTLVDTKNKLVYIGEARDLGSRLRQPHPSIPNWDYFRYDILPDEISEHRRVLERMLIREFAQLLENDVGVKTLRISSYRITNDRIDSR